MPKGASSGTGSLPGFRDFYPEEFATRAFILQTWRDVARRFGFVEYDGPPLEPLDLYTKKSGDETTIVLLIANAAAFCQDSGAG